MSNSRSMRRKLTGKSGHSPKKSKRRLRQRQASAMKMRAAMDSMSTMAADLLENIGPLADMAKEQMDAIQPERDDVPTEEGTEG